MMVVKVGYLILVMLLMVLWDGDVDVALVVRLLVIMLVIVVVLVVVITVYLDLYFHH